MADRAIVDRAVAAAPKDYVVAANVSLRLKAVGATLNGVGAGGPFLPAVQLVAPDGTVMWTAVPAAPIAAGGTAVVSWFPGGNVDEDAATPTGITFLASPSGTLAVTNPAGPTTDVDLAPSGVAAGTYGDSSHSAEITVDADGRITAASNQSIVPSPAAGNIVAYGTHTANVSASGTTFAGGTDLLAAALSFTADGSSDYLALVSGSLWGPGGSSTSFMRCSLNFDGAEAGYMTEQSVANQIGFAFPFNGAAFIAAPSAASHTVNARIYAGFSGVAPVTVQAASGGANPAPIVVWVVKL